VNGHVYPEVDKNNLGSKLRRAAHSLPQSRQGTFADISSSAGPGITMTASSRGLAVGDLWNDGRISAVITNLNAVPSLVVNSGTQLQPLDCHSHRRYKIDRDGIGARISVKVGARTLVDEVRSGSSYNSSSDMRVHFGLGSSTRSTPYRFAGPMGSPNVLTT